MGSRAEVHHAGIVRFHEQRHEQACQHERREPVDRKLGLQAIRGFLPGEREDAGIIYQHIDLSLTRRNHRSESTYVRHGREVRRQECDVRIACRLPYVPLGCVAALHGSAHADHMTAPDRHELGKLQPDSGCRARHDDRFPFQFARHDLSLCD
jgi:hypothetical protein